MKFSCITLLLMCFLLFGIQHQLSGQSLHSGISSLSKGADLIITGKVTRQQTQWNSDKSMISTQVTIQVDEYLKGAAAGNEITLIHPGGEIGDVGEFYSHIPTFQNNEEVLVFLKQYQKDMSYRVFEGESGKVSLILDPSTGEKVTPQHTKLSELKKEIRLSLE